MIDTTEDIQATKKTLEQRVGDLSQKPAKGVRIFGSALLNCVGIF